MKWTLKKAANGYVLETYGVEYRIWILKNMGTWAITWLADHSTLGGKEGAE